jgi:hypothetical protein
MLLLALAQRGGALRTHTSVKSENTLNFKDSRNRSFLDRKELAAIFPINKTLKAHPMGYMAGESSQRRMAHPMGKKQLGRAGSLVTRQLPLVVHRPPPPAPPSAISCRVPRGTGRASLRLDGPDCGCW